MTDTMVIEFSEDLLCGADEISEFLFGDAKYRRRVYYLAARSKLPIFRLRSQLCARKSSLLKFVEVQESRRLGHPSSDKHT
jgi:hypothetical protein